MIKFKDLTNNTIHVRPEDIKVIVIVSPLCADPTAKDLICMTGINSQVSKEVVYDVLKQLGEGTILH